jgi:serine/threonine protein kinase
LLNYCMRHFTPKTVMMLGIQMVHRMEFLHHKGLIHRDIKPENFVFGVGPKGHHLTILDFGLSKRYWDSRAKAHIPFRDNKPLTGTARYCGINAHKGYEQSRRDDLESCGYLLIYFILGSLPWQGIAAPDAQSKTIRIGEKKASVPLDTLCSGCPGSLLKYMKYVRGLKFEETPDYAHLRRLFFDELAANDELGPDGQPDWVFDWIVKRDGETADCSQSAGGDSMCDEQRSLNSVQPHVGSTTHM